MQSTVHRIDSSLYSLEHHSLFFAGHSMSKDTLINPVTREHIHREYISTGDTSRGSETVAMVSGHHGIDVSHWQKNIDWSTVRKDTIPSEIRFAIIKATQGSDHVDPYFRRNWEEATANGFIVGAYHFYMHKQDPVDQAGNYIRNVSLVPGNLVPMIDIELDCSGCLAPDITKEEMANDIRAFLHIIEAHFHVRPVIYTYIKFYRRYLSNDFSDYCYWMSKYSKDIPSGLSIDSSRSMDADPCISIWQFSNSEEIKGIHGTVDMNYATVKSLNAITMK